MKAFILTLTILLPLHSMAQDFSLDKDSGKAVPNFIGQVKLVKGEIFKRVNGELKSIGIGARFYPGDVLVTGEKSFVRVGMIDDTSLTLGGASEFEFTDFKFKDQFDRSATFTLNKGQLSGKVKHKVKNGEIKFRTKFSTMGVRGTELLINHRKLKHYEISEFALLEGRAVVHNKNWQNVDLAMGQKMIYVQDEVRKKHIQDEATLTAEERAELSRVIDEEKEMKPLMPYFDPGALISTSDMYFFFNPKSETLSTQKATEASGGNQKNWRENLRKLNEKLKNNQEDP